MTGRAQSPGAVTPEISGFMVVRDAVSGGYPFVEAIVSALPLCDEFLVSDGCSSDGTDRILRRMQARWPDTLRVFEDPWDAIADNGGSIARVSDRLRRRCRGHYCLYLQANEILHESSLPRLRQLPRDHPEVDLFGLPFVHYMGPIRWHADQRRRLFRNIDEVGVLADGFDCGYQPRPLWSDVARWIRLATRRRGLLDVSLPEPVYRYRAIYPGAYLEKLRRRGRMYSDPVSVAAWDAELAYARRVHDDLWGAERRPPARPPDEDRLADLFWQRCRPRLLAHVPPIDGRLRLEVATGDQHPALMRTALRGWTYDVEASLSRVT